MEIYHSYRSNATHENELLVALREMYPNATYRDQSWHPTPAMLNVTVPKRALIDALVCCTHLPHLKRSRCVLTLRHDRVPQDIRIATDVESVTFDFAIIDSSGVPFLFEVHEKQHRTLAVSRDSLVYGSNGWPVVVPRFLQRLIRDVWRLRACASASIDFAILWFDWMARNPISLAMVPGQHEHALPNRFSVMGLCHPTAQ